MYLCIHLTAGSTYTHQNEEFTVDAFSKWQRRTRTNARNMWHQRQWWWRWLSSAKWNFLPHAAASLWHPQLAYALVRFTALANIHVFHQVETSKKFAIFLSGTFPDLPFPCCCIHIVDVSQPFSRKNFGIGSLSRAVIVVASRKIDCDMVADTSWHAPN